jgi:ATP-dependent exoDNAse (exonuclease V) alpha subunit
LINTFNNKSIIKFFIENYKDNEEDENISDNINTIVPFQIAYATSIHKAQGLEYKSVKVIISDEINETITHDIFYTAITRAIDQLKVY